MPRSIAFVNYAMGRINFPYPNLDPSSLDASALVTEAADAVGVSLPLTGEEQYKLCQSKGLILDVDVAEWMRGALLFEGASGQHWVAISLGNGEVIEARKGTYAVVDFDASGRRWATAGLIPGMDY